MPFQTVFLIILTKPRRRPTTPAHKPNKLTRMKAVPIHSDRAFDNGGSYPTTIRQLPFLPFLPDLDPSEKCVDDRLARNSVSSTSYYIPGITQRARFLDPAPPTNKLVARMMPEISKGRPPTLLSRSTSCRSETSVSSFSCDNSGSNRRRHLFEDFKSASISKIDYFKESEKPTYHPHGGKSNRTKRGESRLPKELLRDIQKLKKRQQRLHKKQKHAFVELHMLQDEKHEREIILQTS